MGRSQDGGAGMTCTPPTPLDHRARRRILRRLHECGRDRTGEELSTDLRLGLDEILYHVRILIEHETVTEKPGADQATARFEAKIIDNAKIIELLISTRAEDEAQQL